MTPSLDQFLKDVEERCKKASPAPWFHGYSDGSGCWTKQTGAAIVSQQGTDAEKVVCHAVDADGCPGGILNKKDAAWIACARTDLPLALKMLRRAVEILQYAAGRRAKADTHEGATTATQTLSDLEQMAKEGK